MTITINQKSVSVESGDTILAAAEGLGIAIPTLCHLKGVAAFTSCMLCLVQEMTSGKLLPACSSLVQDGMIIETDNTVVHHSRKNALDLLLSEHVGDCQAPCQRGCPADMNIPLMIRQISQGQFRDALITVKQDIALPAILGRICPAPCEKVCNRGLHDQPLAICQLKKYVADLDLDSQLPYSPLPAPNSRKSVAIIGAGPAGLAAAYYLSQKGHPCTLFDDHDQPGGMLRYGVDQARLQRKILDAEISQILQPHITRRSGQMVGRDISLEQLQADFSAVALTAGTLTEQETISFGLRWSGRGVEANRQTFQTNLNKVFCAGNSLSPSRLAVRSVGQGKRMAAAIDQFLAGQPLTGLQDRFCSRLGRLDREEVQTLLTALASHSLLVLPARENQMQQEAQRCLHCDCRKLDSCKLRQYSDDYHAEQSRFKGERKKISLAVQRDLVIYEPGKCIKCGLCVRITEQARESLGLTFIGRGFDVRIEVPFGETLAEGLKKTAAACVAACPTAALSHS
jgi:hypothetical protein